MKRILLLGSFLAAALTATASGAFLQKTPGGVRLMVDGKPFMILGGELGNSTAASADEISKAFAKCQAMGLNTALVPVYWELIAPEEGKFDFASVDSAIDMAREHGLRIVLLWFGAWKNSMSCYAPMWVKKDWRRFPRACDSKGNPMEILTPFSPANLKADMTAYTALMHHLAQKDAQQGTVLMMQVENEIGMIPDARDYCPEAQKAFKAEVPTLLLDYIVRNRAQADTALVSAWVHGGSKMHGSWEEVFGRGLSTDEYFMAWYYGVYIESLTQAGKAEHNIPVYLNAALDSRGRKPGEYPSAGPLSHLLDIWRVSAPSIDLLAPDIYDAGFPQWCARYAAGGNPLFIPEIRLEQADGVRALYAFSQHDALGFSPFSIENASGATEQAISKSYAILRQLSPILLSRGADKKRGMIFDDATRECTFTLGGYQITARHDYTLGWSQAARDGSAWPETGGLIIGLAPGEFIVAGSGIVLTFSKDKTCVGIGAIDKVRIEGEHIIPLQRLNGDEDHQGRHLRIPQGEWDIQHIVLYEYGK